MFLPPMLVVASLEAEPDWIARPSGEDIAKAYPRKAMSEGLVGRAVLHCKATAQGRMTDCVVNDLDPVGEGFDEAALVLSKRFVVRTRSRGGQIPSGAPVRIPIRFVLPGTVTLPVVVARRAGVTPTKVSIDCRLNVAGRLDNCLTSHPDAAAARVAYEVVAEANASPSVRPRETAIRVNIPIEVMLPEPR